MQRCVWAQSRLLWGSGGDVASGGDTGSLCCLQCKPEYKVPGLYVIDSIVRQSRHQFGTDKDVFGPRFSKNITATFQYLYLCPSEDKVGQALWVWLCIDGGCLGDGLLWSDLGILSDPAGDCCWEGLSKVTVKCKFKLKDVFCLTSSVLFCLCRHFSSVC